MESKFLREIRRCLSIAAFCERQGLKSTETSLKSFEKQAAKGSRNIYSEPAGACC